MDPKERQALIESTREAIGSTGRLYPGDPGYKQRLTEDELDESACSRPVIADEDQIAVEAEIKRRNEEHAQAVTSRIQPPPQDIPSFLRRFLDASTGATLTDIARNCDVPRNFLYDLLNGHVRKRNESGQRVPLNKDERYKKLDAYFAQRGMSGFLDLVMKSSVATRGHPQTLPSRAEEAMRHLVEFWKLVPIERENEAQEPFMRLMAIAKTLT